MSLSSPARSRRVGRPSLPLRRLLIVPVSIVVVAAIAYAVAGLQSATYSAQSTVVVTSASGSVAGGSPYAGNLAATYSGALPNDSALQGYVARTAHVNPMGAITASAPKGSVVTLQFFANTRKAALAGARAIASALSGPKPTSSVVSPDTLKVVQDPFAATLNPAAATNAASTTASATPLAPPQADTYMAQVVLIVQPGAGGPSVGINPSDADKLATTYAGIIPTDDTLLRDVGHAAGESSAQVAQNLSVVNTQNTSILQISFKASDPRVATSGARAAATLLTRPNPAAAGIVPSSLQIVSLPSNVAPVATSHKSRTVAIGAVLGLILGLVLLVAWERSDPRVTDARSLSNQFGCPATPADRLSADAAHAMLERWAALTDHVPARVAIVPADDAAVVQADEVARLLAHSGDDVRYVDGRSGALPAELTNGHRYDGAESVALVHAGPPGRGGEAVALSCDLTVVVVRSGARNAEVRGMAEELANFGLVPAWALLTPRSGHIATPERSLAGAVSA